MEAVDMILIKRFQKFQSQENILNPVDMDIQTDELWNFASCYKKKFFPTDSLLEGYYLVQALQKTFLSRATD